MSFRDKTIVITGGSKGIGAACVELFLSEGAKVAVLDVAETTNEAVYFQYCDVSSEKEVKSGIENIISKLGDVDILVNNSGIQRYGSVTETSSELWDEVMNVNLKSAFLCSHYSIPSMLNKRGGVIINVASVQAFVSQQKVAAYTTSKTALLGLTRSIAVDYSPQIRCVAVCPGTIDTPMLRDAIQQSPDPEVVLKECEDMHLLKRIGQPREIAELIKFLCSDSAAFITGQAIRIDGGLGIMVQGSKKD
jgi:NAD(P)-dependent dehydrogenase (short-subunit alcohol dehydrogenase family)